MVEFSNKIRRFDKCAAQGLGVSGRAFGSTC
jgi:hypothetical protein